MAPSKKTNNSSSSSSALAVAANQADDSRRTTRGMKAKASQDATTSEDHDNTNTSQDATSSAINTSPSTNDSAKQPISKPASETAQKTKPTTSGPAKGKPAKAQASKPQQNKAPSKAKSKKLATDKVADTSHIIKKTYSNGKTLLNSNGKPKNFQVALDAELDKWLAKENTKRNLWGTQIEPISAPNMRSDFEAMGFNADKVNAMMGTRETLKVDGLTQRPSAGTGKCVPNTGPLPVKKTPKPKGKGKYEQLKIWADQRKFSPAASLIGNPFTNKPPAWILFDPLKGYPTEGGIPPLAVTSLEHYQPDNARIILQHQKKGIIISKATPAALRDRSVDYTDLGPRVAGWKPIGSGRKQPAPEPEPERPAPAPAPAPAPTERPLLGRGAKRNATRAPSSSEATKSSPTAAAAASTTTTKKRKSDDISTAAAAAAAAADSSPAPQVAAESPPALKRARTASPAPRSSPLLASEQAAAEPAGAGESLVGEGVQKRKRRPGRPKKSAARVVESGSE
jgi:hypothetical protein